ncbi:MAG: hypothetical protein V7K32_21355 [Nostoc sp.]|uniref:hypothetical protein n=1 Tax=Nostoc sp. TaxID=1180 RepID=UPI002FFAC0FE
MTQDEYHYLLLSVINEINYIKGCQEYLKIARQLIDTPDSKTSERIELLLSTYLQQTEVSFDNLEYFSKQREKLFKNNNLAADYCTFADFDLARRNYVLQSLSSSS